jgi:hypothetical protein
VAWDAAGATVEFAFSPAEQADLLSAIGRAAGHLVDPEIVRFMTPCYIAFQLGSYVMAAGAAASEVERARLEASVARYRNALRRELGL